MSGAEKPAPDRIPISAAGRIAREYRQRQVVLVTWDGSQTHVVTYGATAEECRQAANGGNMVKRALGWPEELCGDQPQGSRKAVRPSAGGAPSGPR